MANAAVPRSNYDTDRRRGMTAAAKVATVAAAAVVVLLAYLFFTNINDNNDASGIDFTDDEIMASSSMPSAPTNSATSGQATTAAASSFATAGGTDMLAAAQGNTLASLIGQNATATGVNVNSVVADEGFWVGNAQSQVFVHLTDQVRNAAESPFQVAVGQHVNFSGTITATPGDVSALGVTTDEGAAQLQTEGGYVEASTFAIQ